MVVSGNFKDARASHDWAAEARTGAKTKASNKVVPTAAKNRFLMKILLLTPGWNAIFSPLHGDVKLILVAG
jgi:hypothetical protein